MKFEIYSVFDKKANVYLNELDVFSDVVTMSRRFEMLVQSLDAKVSYMAKHLDEYCVYKVGTFDSDSGVLEHCNPVAVLELSVFKKED